MGSMGLGMVLMLSSERLETQLFPAFALCSMALVALYLWFLVVVCMTFVLIRDKKAELRERRRSANCRTHCLERVNSAQF